jgi:cell division protease FtsH
MQVEEEGNHYLMSKEEIENKIATLTGGRAAEEVEFGSVTTGASNDIEQATKLARAMITRYGMSDEFDMVAMETVTNQYLGGDTSLACSAETQALIDRKVVELVRRQHEKALKILRENKRKLDEIAEYLYFKETITGEEFMDILNRKPEPRRIGTAEESVSEGAEKTVSEEAAAAEEQGLPQEQTASGEKTGSEGQTSPATEE